MVGTTSAGAAGDEVWFSCNSRSARERMLETWKIRCRVPNCDTSSKGGVRVLRKVLLGMSLVCQMSAAVTWLGMQRGTFKPRWEESGMWRTEESWRLVIAVVGYLFMKSCRIQQPFSIPLFKIMMLFITLRISILKSQNRNYTSWRNCRRISFRIVTNHDCLGSLLQFKKETLWILVLP